MTTPLALTLEMTVSRYLKDLRASRGLALYRIPVYGDGVSEQDFSLAPGSTATLALPPDTNCLIVRSKNVLNFTVTTGTGTTVGVVTDLLVLTQPGMSQIVLTASGTLTEAVAVSMIAAGSGAIPV